MDAGYSPGFSMGHARNGRRDGGCHAAGSTVFTAFHGTNISIVSIQGYVQDQGNIALNGREMDYLSAFTWIEVGGVIL